MRIVYLNPVVLEAFISPKRFICVFMIDCAVAERKKYCCFRRRVLPSMWSSAGYSTFVMTSLIVRCSRLFTYSPSENRYISSALVLRVPKAEDIDLVAAVAGNEHIARNGRNGLIAGMLGVISAEAVPSLVRWFRRSGPQRLRRCAQRASFRPSCANRRRPRSACRQLSSGGKCPAHSTASSRCRDTERGQRIHIAGREPAEAAVAETRVVFGLEYIRGVAAEILQSAGERALAMPRLNAFFMRLRPMRGTPWTDSVPRGPGQRVSSTASSLLMISRMTMALCLKHLIVGRGFCCHGEVRASLSSIALRTSSREIWLVNILGNS